MSSDFWNMGGYATYVWGSYGVGFLVFAWNLVAPHLTRRTVLEKLRSGEDVYE